MEPGVSAHAEARKPGRPVGLEGPRLSAQVQEGKLRQSEGKPPVKVTLLAC